MRTFVLTGNFDKNGEALREEYEGYSQRLTSDGFADGHWTFSNHGSKPGDRVVLLRQGGERDLRGIIGFGRRIDGHTIPWKDKQLQYPVRFHNLRGLSDEPSLSSAELETNGFAVIDHFMNSGQELTGERLTIFENYCRSALNITLDELCDRHLDLQDNTAIRSFAVSRAAEDRAEIERIEAPLSETDRDAVIKARIGQGLFRDRVLAIEPRCRVTGIGNRDHLIASHIKPWAKSDNRKRLDGNNGLMLAPHIDHLFDAGLITFQQDGALLLSPDLDQAVITAWGLSITNVGAFSAEQERYLQFHRNHVFRTCAASHRPLAGTV